MWCTQIEASLQRIAEAKQKNLRVVVASGCFDILHVGHIRYLHEAKKLGDYLVVFISDDASVKMIKGRKRPIIPEQERKEMLMAIKGVDDVIIHRENDFISLLRETYPAFFVKGKDYGEGDFRWLESYAEQVALVGYAPTSTSQIINKCLDHYGEGSQMEFLDDSQFPTKLDFVLRHHQLGKLQSWRYMSGGIHTNIYLTNTQQRKFFLKIPCWRNPSFSEFDVYQFLFTHTNLPIPRPICQDLSFDILPRFYFILEYMEGISCDFERDISFEIGQALRFLHSQTMKVVNKWPYTPMVNWRKYLENLAMSNLQLCQPFIENSTWKTLDKIFSTSSPIIPQHPNMALLHRDLKPQNVLLDDNDNISVILDFEWAHIGDPLFDLASTGCYLSARESSTLQGYFANETVNVDAKLLCLYNLIDLIHVMGRATYVLESPRYFILMNQHYLHKILNNWHMM